MRKLLIVIASLPLLLLVYIAVLNLLPDEQRSPQAVAWLTSDRALPNKEQNSYYLIWGLAAPVGVSMREYGEARVDKIVQADSEKPVDGIYSEERYLPEGFDPSANIEATGMSDLCDLSEMYCLDSYKTGLESLLSQDDNALLLERYRTLISLPHYQSITPVGIRTPYPSYHLLIAGQHLNLAAIASRFLEGERSAALDALVVDLRYARMLMAEADILIVRMVALKMLANTLHLYSQLLDQPDSTDVITAVAEITPLSESERNAEEIFRGEFSVQASTIQLIDDKLLEEFTGEELGALFYLQRLRIPVRANRMFNTFHEHTLNLIELSELAPSEIEVRSVAVMEEIFAAPGLLDYLYDPITSVLWGVAIPDYSQYLLRHRNLDGLIRLVKLKGRIRAEVVTAEKLDEYIAASPYASAYVQEQTAIRWDPEEQTLSYTQVGGDDTHYLNRIFVQ